MASPKRPKASTRNMMRTASKATRDLRQLQLARPKDHDLSGALGERSSTRPRRPGALRLVEQGLRSSVTSPPLVETTSLSAPSTMASRRGRGAPVRLLPRLLDSRPQEHVSRLRSAKVCRPLAAGADNAWPFRPKKLLERLLKLARQSTFAYTWSTGSWRPGLRRRRARGARRSSRPSVLIEQLAVGPDREDGHGR